MVGLAFAYAGGNLLRSAFLPQVAWFGSPVDMRVFLLTAILSGATGLLAGLAPALKGSRGDVVQALKDGDRGGSARRSRSQTLLLLTQAALSVILLAGAGLFIQSLHQAQDLDLGLEPEGLVLAELDLDGEREIPAELALWQEAMERVRRLPGVQSASLGSNVPFRGMAAFDLFAEGVDSIPAPRSYGPFVSAGSEGHLNTLGVALREGRMFTDQEAAAGARVVVVTENMARGIWGQENPLGRCLMINDRAAPCWEVVGVVEDHHLSGVTGEAPWQYYLPFGEATMELELQPGALFIRSAGDASSLLGPTRRELQALDPAVRFAHVRLQQDLVDPQLRSWRLGATMFSLFGALALIVAAVGLYSVLAFNVSRRIREMGVRSAVGASRTNLITLVVREAMEVVVVGITLGITLSLLAGPRLGPLLFQTSPRDPAILGTVAAILLLVATAASALPAWRASRVDPISALRAE
jgi:predicted permease